MNYSSSINRKITCAAIGIAITGISMSTALAADDDMTANVEILANISVVVNTPMNFGVLAKPSSGSAVVTLSESGETASLTAGTDARHWNTGVSRGKFTIDGDSNQTANFTLTITSDFSVDGTIVLSDLTHTGTDTGVIIGADGGTEVFVGGTLTVSSDATPGTPTATVNVNVNYD